MTSIRKFVYAALLAVTALNITPAVARAEEVGRGQFTLLREVHWRGVVVPAGDYRFSLESSGAAGMLHLTKLDGKPAGFVFLVTDTELAKSADPNRLVLETTPEGTYVSAMQLPEFGVTLHFPVPEERQVARVGTPPRSGQ